jgi:hypothetical protein
MSYKKSPPELEVGGLCIPDKLPNSFRKDAYSEKDVLMTDTPSPDIKDFKSAPARRWNQSASRLKFSLKDIFDLKFGRPWEFVQPQVRNPLFGHRNLLMLEMMVTYWGN